MITENASELRQSNTSTVSSSIFYTNSNQFIRCRLHWIQRKEHRKLYTLFIVQVGANIISVDCIQLRCNGNNNRTTKKSSKTVQAA